MIDARVKMNAVKLISTELRHKYSRQSVENLEHAVFELLKTALRGDESLLRVRAILACCTLDYIEALKIFRKDPKNQIGFIKQKAKSLLEVCENV